MDSLASLIFISFGDMSNKILVDNKVRQSLGGGVRMVVGRNKQLEATERKAVACRWLGNILQFPGKWLFIAV